MALAIFDLDNTLLNGDSDHAFGQFLVDKGAVDAEHFQQANDRFYQDYKDGTLDITRYLQFALAPLEQHPMATLEQWRQEFMQEIVEPMILAKGRELLMQHRRQGDFLLIITATNDFVTRPIAKSLGVDSLIATQAECLDGHFTGRVVGVPSFQHGKIERLEQWLLSHPHNLNDSYFYSDSINDLPLLRLVDNPVAVDPDERLRAIATRYDWPILSLRD